MLIILNAFIIIKQFYLIYINYIKRNIIIIKGKVLGIVLSINFNNLINYWTKVLEELNIFYNFIKKGIIIIIIITIVIIDFIIIILLLSILITDIII